MRISDWSSDVCSSDLNLRQACSSFTIFATEPTESCSATWAYRLFRISMISSWALRNASRSEEHTSELQSLMRISYAVFCLKKKKKITKSPAVCITQYPNLDSTYNELFTE